jgi:mitochondrial inner membrane protease ATP23
MSARVQCALRGADNNAAMMQVVICHNHVGSQQEIDIALVHELVHAYDHCRGANLDWSNCEHHACSEVQSRSARVG